MARPTIGSTEFGSITVDGQRYDYDIVIRLDGEIVKRKKKLSKRIYGTSHIVSKDEAKFLYEDGCERLVVGAGQYDSVRLSDEAEKFFAKRGITVERRATPEAVPVFNSAGEKTVAIFHVTC